MNAQVIHGDCMDVLAGMAANTVDAIVCDPPYEIGFMGKGWDGSGIAYRVELWAECLRVLKPGGHLLAFGGTRTYHRMTSAIDDAGFDIRDSLHWVYGSGFPKSLDVSKAIDKAAGAEREVVGSVVRTGSAGSGKTVHQEGGDKSGVSDITAPATDAARQWSGWGTALKPAHEPIVVARKPLTGTVAANVLTHSTGALNIDGCRVGFVSEGDRAGAQALADLRAKGRRLKVIGEAGQGTSLEAAISGDTRTGEEPSVTHTAGRWPANLVLTHAHNCADRCAPGCPVAELDGQSGRLASGVLAAHHRRAPKDAGILGAYGSAEGERGYGDSGGASRFFTVTEWDPTADVAPFRYVAKPSKRERNAGLDGLEGQSVGAKGNGLARRCATCDASVIDGCDCPDRTFVNPTRQNHHPTVKPVALMRWLVRLVTPPGGTVLDPFAGSGTTLVAAVLEGFHSIGIELTDDYHPIIAGRLAWAETYTGTSHPPRAPTTARTATPTTEPPLTLFDVEATE